MTFDENACIRYLMKEMDPSEELLFEKKMMEDENLLIEVESLRKVNQRLSGLPEIKPPKTISQNIILKASEYHQNKRTKQRITYFSAAATILVIFVAGAFLIMEENEATAGDSHASEASLGSASAPAFELKLESASNSITPWVDNNEELHFEDRFNADRAAAFDSIMNNSFQRLQPLQDRERRNDRARGLHLTGSSN
jgi:hypothetical protein